MLLSSIRYLRRARGTISTERDVVHAWHHAWWYCRLSVCVLVSFSAQSSGCLLICLLFKGLYCLPGIVPKLAVPENLVCVARDRYWWVGLSDLKQESHTLKRNFPVLANIR